ncbi:hypothetical protein GUITHDRAFT_107194 [Guillardia theta CCMP2712]|uniref:Uncharacterized protein n=1 Tax=Guillardia theta (strain CCMP2712) TaxID=905079 RepID=L1JE90_GUITC|nr:hypothetical protein GUITHDRAFT_107194 [Guillardia theta CCMP2712]EKX46838.1 hypothetical protein GUITHDRAFT_107194 [Guillardia theta CCMP2712]|eukprot:XP_005833818.1 hypothetical protein GUITHDRAFT_107194 [Guillardia theta CCMP2712]
MIIRRHLLLLLQLGAVALTSPLKQTPLPSVYDYLDGRKTRYFEGKDYFLHIPVAPPRWILDPDQKALKEASLEPEFLDFRLDYFQSMKEANETWWKTVGCIKYAQNKSWANMLKSLQPLILAEEDPYIPHGRKNMTRKTAHFNSPMYYVYDRSTFSYFLPLRSESDELVSLWDITKKLWKCCENGQTNLARTCIEAGAYLNAVDYTNPLGYTAVLWAAFGGHGRTLRMLAEMGANLEARDQSNGNALHVAARYGFTDVCSDFFELTDGNLYAKDDYKRLAVHVSSFYGHADTTERLVNLGSNVNAQDYRKDTPLHLCCYKGDLRTAKILVWLGADLWRKNFRGKSVEKIELSIDRQQSVMGEKCVFRGIPYSAIRCKERHPHFPPELFHRMSRDDVENVTAPNDDAWKYGNPELDSNDPSSIYRNPEAWESILKSTEDVLAQGRNYFARDEGVADLIKDREEQLFSSMNQTQAEAVRDLCDLMVAQERAMRKNTLTLRRGLAKRLIRFRKKLQLRHGPAGRQDDFVSGVHDLFQGRLDQPHRHKPPDLLDMQALKNLL